MTKKMTKNFDKKVVADFGAEWSRFDQKQVPTDELVHEFGRYFSIFPWELLPAEAIGFDMGCGSGRWAQFVAPRVHQLHCVDLSDEALCVAKTKLANEKNCSFHLASVDDLPFDLNSMDFCYSLGVLHHIPDTAAGMRDCVSRLKRGGVFLVYLYYAFDGRPAWFVYLWRLSDFFREVISQLPRSVKVVLTDLIAVGVYWPLSRLARIFEAIGVNVSNWPLSFYRKKSFYTLRTDALDRFGTTLEKRFTKLVIEEMMTQAGLINIRFNATAPFWCAVGIKS